MAWTVDVIRASQSGKSATVVVSDGDFTLSGTMVTTNAGIAAFRRVFLRKKRRRDRLDAEDAVVEEKILTELNRLGNK